jgi:hypothetical protein
MCEWLNALVPGCGAVHFRFEAKRNVRLNEMAVVSYEYGTLAIEVFLQRIYVSAKCRQISRQFPCH